MKVVVAPDKFAGTLAAAEAAEAIAEGWRRARPADEVVLAPMADGGEGTIDVLQTAVVGARLVEVEVADARGHATASAWLRLPDGRAVVEVARACGLSRLTPEQRDPRLATTYGVGQLLADAFRAGVSQVVVGLGGSATVDGGAGMATALGHRLLRSDGNRLKVGGEYLRDLATIEPADPAPVPVVAAVDVTNPLLGPEGAAVVFAPQKGAAPDDVGVLEAALARLADVTEETLPGGPWRELPGAGAAGGLGFGLAAFCAAPLVGGAEVVADLVGLADEVATADVVVTGEGKLDAQSERGKTPVYVADLAGKAGVTVYAVAGRVDDGAGARFDAVAELGPEGLSRARDLVVARTEELARRFESRST